MHSTILRKAILLIFITGLLLPACSSRNSLPTPTATAIATPAPTEYITQTKAPEPTETLIPKPTATRTLKPRFTKTNVPTLTLTPTLTPTPQPLSQEGPWLVIAVDGLVWSSYSQFLIMNADGSGVVPIGLPALNGNRAWVLLSESNSPYLAFRTVMTEVAPYAIEPNGVDEFVWVVKLPENKVVKKLPLLNEAAWKAIQEERANNAIDYNKGFGIIPVQLGLVTDPRSFQSSPDGRYLTYSAALGGKGTDLYLYDTKIDSVRRLTYGREGAQAWFWSPDSRTIMYSNGSSYDAGAMFPGLVEPDGRYSYDLSTGSGRKLYKPETDEWVFSRSNGEFLVADIYFETPPLNLREVNYQTGAIRYIFKDKFSMVAAVDEGSERSILLLFDPSVFMRLPEGFQAGVYRVDAGSGKLKLVREGLFGGMDYEASLGLFSAWPDSQRETSNTVLFDRNGVEKLRLKGTLRVNPSPDGKWIIGGGKLYNASGEAMTEEKWGTTIWLRDSSGFFAYSRDEDIRFYGESRDWKPVKVYEGKVNEVFVIEKR